ncbi:hypothetical Protein YC6258_05634 [Gynuella sunshinyii YC6258]|uniref:Uncharacterized protein n=1 Tax=Gynuella sunshinyii YC6258 TaxID=1445510 RepID=A0A0C5VWH6_9GAMM|nr:hypothetical Protein YC6258_05634 [Gynuella sunshinyii YC6258]
MTHTALPGGLFSGLAREPFQAQVVTIISMMMATVFTVRISRR